MLRGCNVKWRQMAANASREGPEQSSALPCSKRVTLGHSLCLPLVSSLNGDHVHPDLPPQSSGKVSKETAETEFSARPTGSWCDGRGGRHRLPESIKEAEYCLTVPDGSQSVGIIDSLLLCYVWLIQSFFIYYCPRLT